VSNLREDDTHEFKEMWSKTALEDIAALANHKGGVLLIGIADDGTIVGLEEKDSAVQAIVNQIVDVLGVNPRVDWRSYAGKQVLAVEVDAAAVPVTCKGRYLVRVGSTNRTMTREQLTRRLLKSSGQQWDALATDATLDDVDADALQRFIRLARSRLPNLQSENAAEQILKNLNVLRDDHLLNAGVLLFGKAPQHVFPSAQVRAARFEGKRISNDQSFGGSLWDQLEACLNYFQQQLDISYEVTPTDLSLEGIQRTETWEHPLEALREALLNALMHRDYMSLGDIQIRLYPDRLQIWNPGSLPEGISLEDLKRDNHPSQLRNPLLAQAFYFAGYVERWGSGTTRIIQACRDQGLPEPEFDEQAGGFRIVFYKNILTPERLVNMGLNERQVAAVAFAQEHGSISNSELQDITGASRPTATRDLKTLIELGIAVSKGRGRGAHYVLKESIDS